MATNGVAHDDFKPKNILVTGGAGFIASHVALRLVKNYPAYKVVVLDKLDYCSSTNNLASVKDRPNFKFVKGDIQSMDLMAFLLRTEEIDTVMHFAAQVSRKTQEQGGVVATLRKGAAKSGCFNISLSALQVRHPPSPQHGAKIKANSNEGKILPLGQTYRPTHFPFAFLVQTHVDNSFGNSLAFTMNNTYGTHVLLEACRMAGTIRRFINVSTDEVYGETSLGKEEGKQQRQAISDQVPRWLQACPCKNGSQSHWRRWNQGLRTGNDSVRAAVKLCSCCATILCTQASWNTATWTQQTHTQQPRLVQRCCAR
jgi:hypothetical protein